MTLFAVSVNLRRKGLSRKGSKRASVKFPSDVISGFEKKIFVDYLKSLQTFVLFFDLVIEISPNSQISK